jgi:2,3-dihydroxybenzoate decarboxylase
MVKKIALEEHFLSPGFDDYWRPTVANVDPKFAGTLLARLTDFGEMRLQAMDQAGIARSVLSIAGPGVQCERDTATALHRARESNDFLAREVQKRPDRYSGFAHLPMQDPRGAADELERCMRDLGFAGAMINGHTNGQYLDHPTLHSFWERAESLGAPIYIHPTDPVSLAPVLEGYNGLRRATWEWGFETGSHALRLYSAGCSIAFPAPR